MLTREKLLELISEHDLSQYADAILNASKPAIHISRKRVADDSEIPVGASKLGGSPDVPEGFVWPQWNGTPLTFIGQFRMSDVAPFDVEHVLPTMGLLSFFYAADWQPTGLDASADWGSWRIYHFAEKSVPVQRFPHPIVSRELKLGALFPCAVQLSSELTLPVFSHESLPDPYIITVYSHGPNNSAFMFPSTEIDKLYNLRSSIDNLLDPSHQLLGNPVEIQNDVRRECQFCSHGGMAMMPPLPLSPGVELEAGIKDWRLLLQIESDEAEDGLGIMWGDVGTIYYCITQDTLERRDFNHCWLMLQMG